MNTNALAKQHGAVLEAAPGLTELVTESAGLVSPPGVCLQIEERPEQAGASGSESRAHPVQCRGAHLGIALRTVSDGVCALRPGAGRDSPDVRACRGERGRQLQRAHRAPAHPGPLPVSSSHGSDTGRSDVVTKKESLERLAAVRLFEGFNQTDLRHLLDVANESWKGGADLFAPLGPL